MGAGCWDNKKKTEMSSQTDNNIDQSDKTDVIKAALSLRLRAFFKMNNTRIYQNRRFGFLLAGAAVLFLGSMVLPEDTAQPTMLVTEMTAPVIDLSRHDLYLDRLAGKDVAQLDIKTIRVKSGDSLGPLLQKNGLSGQEAYKVTEAFSTVYKPRNVRVGQKFGFHYTDGTLDHLTFKPSVERTIFVDRKGETYEAKEVAAEFKYETMSVSSQILNSLYVDATRLGAPDKVLLKLVIYFSQVLVRAVRRQIIIFMKMQRAARTFMMQKVKQQNVNSVLRQSTKHPILGYRKMHTGVDFAAPRGTPILAAGSGTVERANRYGGYGM